MWTVLFFCASEIIKYAQEPLFIGVRAIFCQGGGKPFAQKFFQVAQIFTKESIRSEGRCNNIGRTGIMARYSFSGSIPAKFEHKLRRHKQTFGKIATTVVLSKDENLFWSGLNEMKPLPIILAAIFLRGNCSSKIDHRSFFLQ